MQPRRRSGVFFARVPLGAVVATALVCVLALLVPTPALAARQGALAIRSQSAIYHPSTRDVTFRIVFNRAPDFLTVDQYGRPADSFQYFIGTLSGGYQGIDSIVRGEEIHSTGHIVIRNALPPDPDPTSGGWGAIRDQVPFKLSGRVLRFEVPLRSLTDRTTLTELPYRLMVVEFGGGTASDILDDVRIRGQARP